MINYLFGNKPSIDASLLEANKINQINRKEIVMDKYSLMTITGSGKFYKGTWKGEPVSIKVKIC
jgi:hypothetical protein